MRNEAQMTVSPDAGSKEELSQAQCSLARALAPKLRERAARCELEGKVPEETIEDFVASGLFRATHPNGTLDWDIVCEVIHILASACGSQAWIYWVFVNHAQMISSFSAEARREVLGPTDSYQLISASIEPVGRAKPVEGGVILSGQHKFASGIDHASWLICGGHIDRDGVRDGPFLFLIPKSAVVIKNDWNTLGLEGTGSKSFEVTEVFVPQHRCARMLATGGDLEAASSSSKVRSLPRGEGITSAGFAALAVGMAKGVLEEWLDYTRTRKVRGLAIAEQQATHVLAAQASAEIDAAEALYLTYLRALSNKAANGQPILESERMTSKRNVAFACQLALNAGTRLFNSAGARALFKDSPIQRQYRNLLAASAHFAVAWNGAAVDYGRTALAADSGGKAAPN